MMTNLLVQVVNALAMFVMHLLCITNGKQFVDITTPWGSASKKVTQSHRK